MAEVTVNGLKIAFEVQGEGPPVLLVCGTMMPASMWSLASAPTLLQAGYQVITFDNRGMPPSDVPKPPWTVDDMASDTIGLMEHLDLGPYAVMGASLGGMITQRVSLRRPDLVRAAVFIVSGGNLNAFARMQGQAFIDLLAAGVAIPQSLLVWSMLPAVLPPDKLLDSSAIEGIAQVAGMFGGMPADGMHGQFAADVMWGHEDHLEELAGLEVPALAVANEFDVAFPPASVKQAVERMPNGEYVEIRGAPHVSLDPASAAAINAAVGEFLGKTVPVGV